MVTFFKYCACVAQLSSKKNIIIYSTTKMNVCGHVETTHYLKNKKFLKKIQKYQNEFFFFLFSRQGDKVHMYF